MNRLVAKQFDQIDAAISDVRELMAEVREAMQKQQETRDELLMENWGSKKELATLHRMARDYERLESENTKLRGMLDDFRDRLGRVLACTKALRGEFQP